MERCKTIVLLEGKNISQDALCCHYHKIQSLPINFHRKHGENVSVTRGKLFIFISPSGCQFGTGAHTQRMSPIDRSFHTSFGYFFLMDG